MPIGVFLINLGDEEGPPPWDQFTSRDKGFRLLWPADPRVTASAVQWSITWTKALAQVGPCSPFL